MEQKERKKNDSQFWRGLRKKKREEINDLLIILSSISSAYLI